MRGVPPPSAVVGAVAAKGVVIGEVGVWRVGGELALLQTGNSFIRFNDFLFLCFVLSCVRS